MKAGQDVTRLVKIQKFFQYGYQVDSELFLALFVDDLLDWVEAARGKEFHAELCELLKVGMTIHEGHPEKYAKMAKYLEKFDIDCESIKAANRWMPIEQQ